MMQSNSQQRDKALRHIYTANRERICSFIMSNSGSADEAKDIFQETVIAFYENVRDQKFKGESAISTYLYSIARFKWLNQLKKNKTRDFHHQELETDEFDRSTLARMINEEEKAGILEVLTKLGDVCKKILIESLYHNASMKEITAQGNFSSEQVVRNKKYKCLQKLKQLIVERPKLINVLKAYE